MNKIFEDNKINFIKLDYLFYSVLSFILFIPGANLFYPGQSDFFNNPYDYNFYNIIGYISFGISIILINKYKSIKSSFVYTINFNININDCYFIFHNHINFQYCIFFIIIYCIIEIINYLS